MDSSGFLKKIILLSIVVLPLFMGGRIEPFSPELSGQPRLAKECLSLLTALLFSGLILYQGGFRAVRNPWFLGFLGFSVYSMYLAPVTHINIEGQEAGGFWHYKPLFQWSVYLLFFMAINSYPWKQNDIHKIMSCHILAGSLLSLYVLCQWIGWDQFQASIAEQSRMSTYNYELSGTFGTPMLTAAYLAFTVPFFLRRIYLMPLPILALCCIANDMAVGAATIGMSLYFIRVKKILIGIALLVLVFGLSYAVKNTDMFHTSGRIVVWKNTIDYLDKELGGKKFSLTGFGPGSYGFFIKKEYPKNFDRAHNEYLEVLFHTGKIGFILFAGALLWFIIIYWKTTCYMGSCFLPFFISNIVLLLLAAGIYIFQEEPFRYMFILNFGLIHYYLQNKEDIPCLKNW